MKKIIYVILLIIIIPYIVISLFIYDDEIKFNYTANMKVRVKRNTTGKIDEINIGQVSPSENIIIDTTREEDTMYVSMVIRRGGAI